MIGSEDELQERAVEGWDEFEGHTPHRPWVDAVKIRCAQLRRAGQRASRTSAIPGSTPASCRSRRCTTATTASTGASGSRPTSSPRAFPGQFRNWFYSMLVMSTRAGGHARRSRRCSATRTLRDENGEEMHKSKGNTIAFDEAADIVGADVMRWLYVDHAPEQNLRFPRIPTEAEAAAARAAGPAAAPHRPVDAGARAAGQALERLLVLRAPTPTSTASTRRRARLPVGSAATWTAGCSPSCRRRSQR